MIYYKSSTTKHFYTYPNMQMPRLKKIETLEAPKALGPYSQGVSTTNLQGHDLIFVSGMLPIDPSTGIMLQGDIRLLTRQVILNLSAVLNAGGSHLRNVLKVDVFLIDLKNDFALMNEEYAVWFTGNPSPARQTIQVSALPLHARVEISCIAIGND